MSEEDIFESAPGDPNLPFKKGTTKEVPEEEFDLSPIEPKRGMLVITVTGEKGEGKTTQALGAPGTIGAVSMDRKTSIIHQTAYGSDERIKVFDGIRYYSEDMQVLADISKSGARNFRYLIQLLHSMRGKFDWILIDGLEATHELCEMKMRADHNLAPTQGFSTLIWWKERKFNLRAIHNAALSASKRGVIYTTFMEFEKSEVKDGDTVKGKKVPKWVDLVKTETDISVYVYAEQDRAGKIRHYAEVLSSKDPTILRTGVRVDVSDGKSVFLKLKRTEEKPKMPDVGVPNPTEGPKTDDIFS